MEHVFEILKQRPTLTIILGFVLALVLIFILKNQIIDWVKKRYGLFSKYEITEAMKKSTDKVSSYKAFNETNDLIISNLKHFKHNEQQ